MWVRLFSLARPKEESRGVLSPVFPTDLMPGKNKCFERNGVLRTVEGCRCERPPPLCSRRERVEGSEERVSLLHSVTYEPILCEKESSQAGLLKP